MTLGEAIKHCEEVVEENQRVVDTGVVFDDVTIDMLYCDDTEVIEEHLANYQKCASEYRQLAEWLNELKAYKEHGEDAISRREALNAITMAEVRWQAVDNVNKLPSVSPQPCEDAISRQAVLDYIDKMPSELTADGRRMIRRRTLEEYISDTLPSVTPQQKVGQWIEHFDESGKWYECDQCHTDWGGPVNYCPNCGTKMEAKRMTREEAIEILSRPKSMKGAPVEILTAHAMAIKALEQEPVFDKIRAEIDRQEKWLLQAGYNAYNVDIAFDAIKSVVAESEDKG